MFDSEMIQFLRPYPGLYMVPVLPVKTGLSCRSPQPEADTIICFRKLYLRFLFPYITIILQLNYVFICKL